MSTSFEYGLNAAAKEYDGTNKYIRITDIDDDSREFSQEDVTSPDQIYQKQKAINYQREIFCLPEPEQVLEKAIFTGFRMGWCIMRVF